MKKLLFLLLFPIAVFAQTDSTEIKLQHYKDLFVKGLISTTEYDQLKQQTLGLKAPQQTILAKETKTVPAVDSVQIEVMRRHYTGTVAVGCAGIVIGVALITGGAMYQKEQLRHNRASVDGSITNQQHDRVVIGTLFAFGSASSVIGITCLSVGISQWHKVNKYDKALTFNITPSSMGLALAF